MDEGRFFRVRGQADTEDGSWSVVTHRAECYLMCGTVDRQACDACVACDEACLTVQAACVD
jgi:hypothetical protein